MTNIFLDKPLWDGIVERPLDFLNNMKGKIIEIEFKSKKTKVKGKLIAFDIHINIVIEKEGKKEYTFLRGDDIFSIEEVSK